MRYESKERMERRVRRKNATSLACLHSRHELLPSFKDGGTLGGLHAGASLDLHGVRGLFVLDDALRLQLLPQHVHQYMLPTPSKPQAGAASARGVTVRWLGWVVKTDLLDVLLGGGLDGLPDLAHAERLALPAREELLELHQHTSRTRT